MNSWVSPWFTSLYFLPVLRTSKEMPAMLKFLFSFQHQDRSLGYDVVFFVLVNYLNRALLKENGQVAFLRLKRQVFHILFPAFPDVFFVGRNGQWVARSHLDNISALDFLLFLNSRRQIKTAVRLVRLF